MTLIARFHSYQDMFGVCFIHFLSSVGGSGMWDYMCDFSLILHHSECRNGVVRFWVVYDDSVQSATDLSFKALSECCHPCNHFRESIVQSTVEYCV